MTRKTRASPEARPKVLTLWLDWYYGHQNSVVESTEQTFWGHGLMQELGFEEVHVGMEQAVKDRASAEARMREHAPYDWCFIGPFQDILPWVKPLVAPAPVLVWMSDDAWRFSDFGRSWMPAADFIATTHEPAVEKYRSAGFSGAILTNWACRPQWAKWGTVDGKAAEASFCGILYGSRRDQLREIAEAGPVPVRWVNCWPSPTPPETYHEMMSQYAFALALTMSSHGPRQTKARLFEPQIHGTILLTEPAPRLADYWKVDEE